MNCEGLTPLYVAVHCHSPPNAAVVFSATLRKSNFIQVGIPPKFSSVQFFFNSRSGKITKVCFEMCNKKCQYYNIIYLFIYFSRDGK